MITLLLLFSVASRTCNGFDFHEEYSYKLKSIDLEYGERLTSLEQGAARQNVIQKDDKLQLLNGKNTKKLCTAESPIPPLDPSYVPSSSSIENNNIDGGNDISGSGDGNTPGMGPYNAPTPPTDKPFFVDDE